MLCFQLNERRSGEICNACVLLVKRFKKLPPGNDRNWRHVVDARAGPGIKSLTKFKAKNKRKLKDKSEKLAKKKHVYVKTDVDREQSPPMSDDLNEDYRLTDSKALSRSGSISDDDDDIGSTEKPLDHVQHQDVNEDDDFNFLDLSYYKREITCCGSIFRGANGEIIMYSSSLKPCVNIARRQLTSLTVASPIHSSASTSPVHSVESPSSSSETSSKQTKTDSDSSSDSGYDESSNQGENKIAKNVQVQADVKMIEEAVRPIELDQLSSCKTLQSVNITNQSLQSVSN